MTGATDNNANCVECKTKVVNGITCDLCDGWLHAKCIGLGEADFKKVASLVKKIPESCKVSCGPCYKIIKRFGKVTEDISNIAEKEKINEANIAKQEQEMSSLQEKLDNLIRSTRKEIDDMKNASAVIASTSSSASSDPHLVSNLQNNVDKIREEQEKRNEKKMLFCIT